MLFVTGSGPRRKSASAAGETPCSDAAAVGGKSMTGNENRARFLPRDMCGGGGNGLIKGNIKVSRPALRQPLK
jgi:hypothetical protein